MKGKTKQEIGITLIALIITIVVLLILAVVTIGAIKNDGIISYADNSTEKYKDAQTKEEGTLGYYEAYLAGTVGTWTKDGDTITKVNNDGTKTEVKIGDTFTNAEVLAATGGTQSSYTGTWTVLGVENGRLKLVSTTYVASGVTLGTYDPEVFKKDEEGNPTEELKDEIVEIYGENDLDLEKAIWSYQHAVETLNGHAKTATGIKSARSITIEDIEAVLNITDEKKQGSSFAYGMKYNFFYNTAESKVSFKFKRLEEEQWDIWVYDSGYECQFFVDINRNFIVVDSSEDLASVDINSYYLTGLELNSNLKNVFEGKRYWLAGMWVDDMGERVLFAVPVLSQGTDIMYRDFFTSNGENRSQAWSSEDVSAIVLI